MQSRARLHPKPEFFRKVWVVPSQSAPREFPALVTGQG